MRSRPVRLTRRARCGSSRWWDGVLVRGGEAALVQELEDALDGASLAAGARRCQALDGVTCAGHVGSRDDGDGDVVLWRVHSRSSRLTASSGRSLVTCSVLESRTPQAIESSHASLRVTMKDADTSLAVLKDHRAIQMDARSECSAHHHNSFLNSSGRIFASFSSLARSFGPTRSP